MAGFIFLAMALSLPEKRIGQTPPFEFFGLTTFSFGAIGLQMLLDRGERPEWFNSGEIWAEAAASVLGCYLYLVHVLTAKAHFLDKALFKDYNFVLSAIMYFTFGFVLLPTIALTSPMLDELLKYPAHTTGYMAIPRSIALVGALILAGRVPARIDNRLLVAGGGCSTAGSTASTARRWPSACRRHPRQNTRCPPSSHKTWKLSSSSPSNGKNRSNCRTPSASRLSSSVKQAGASAYKSHHQPGLALCEGRGNHDDVFSHRQAMVGPTSALGPGCRRQSHERTSACRSWTSKTAIPTS
jgi:hypothetical protein